MPAPDPRRGGRPGRGRAAGHPRRGARGSGRPARRRADRAPGPRGPGAASWPQRCAASRPRLSAAADLGTPDRRRAPGHRGPAARPSRGAARHGHPAGRPGPAGRGRRNAAARSRRRRRRTGRRRRVVGAGVGRPAGRRGDRRRADLPGRHRGADGRGVAGGGAAGGAAAGAHRRRHGRGRRGRRPRRRPGRASPRPSRRCPPSRPRTSHSRANPPGAVRRRCRVVGAPLARSTAPNCPVRLALGGGCDGGRRPGGGAGRSAGFDDALAGSPARLVRDDGLEVDLAVRRWRRAAAGDDRWLLDRCRGPAVDLGMRAGPAAGGARGARRARAGGRRVGGRGAALPAARRADGPPGRARPAARRGDLGTRAARRRQHRHRRRPAAPAAPRRAPGAPRRDRPGRDRRPARRAVAGHRPGRLRARAPARRCPGRASARTCSAASPPGWGCGAPTVTGAAAASSSSRRAGRGPRRPPLRQGELEAAARAGVLHGRAGRRGPR